MSSAFKFCTVFKIMFYVLHYFFFLAVLAESLKSLAVGAPFEPTLRIFSPEPAAIRFFLAAILAYKPILVATHCSHLLSWFSFRSSSHLHASCFSVCLSFFFTLSCVRELLVFYHWHIISVSFVLQLIVQLQ